MSEEDNPQNHHVKKTREDCDVNGLKRDVSDENVASKQSQSKPKKKGGKHHVSETTKEHDVNCDVSDED